MIGSTDVAVVPAYPSSSLDKIQEMKQQAARRKDQAEKKSQLDQLLSAGPAPPLEPGESLAEIRKTLSLVLIKDGEARYKFCEDMMDLILSAQGLSEGYRKAWANAVHLEMQDLVRGGHGRMEDAG